jgi:hypothetical protein
LSHKPLSHWHFSELEGSGDVIDRVRPLPAIGHHLRLMRELSPQETQKRLTLSHESADNRSSD